MDLTTLFTALLLGLVEGLTEFLPVSSTGHLILLVDLLGFQGPPGRVFEIVIQLGAVLAVLVVYFGRLLGVLLDAPSDPDARRFIFGILIAFLPSALVGVLAHGFIKSVLFSPWVVAVALIVGGVAIIAIERRKRTPVYPSVESFPLLLCAKIGLIQCLAMVPGVSRSGATILGALLLGAERRAAAEFSFFLAIPTMLGAATYDLYKNRATMDDSGILMIALGFMAAFLTALAVVRWLVRFVQRHGFTPFAWYRIVLGSVMLVVLSLR